MVPSMAKPQRDRRHDFFHQVVVSPQRCEAPPPGDFDFVKVLEKFFRCRQILRQRPFKRVVPKIRGDAPERLLYHSRAAQNLFAPRNPAGC
jgi:hypothetical protein